MEEENSQKNGNEIVNNNNNKNGIIAVLVVVIIALIVSVIYFAFIKKEDKLVDNNGVNNGQVDNNDVSTKSLESLNVYCRIDFDDCLLTTVSSDAGKLFYTIETETANPTVVGENYDFLSFYKCFL